MFLSNKDAEKGTRLKTIVDMKFFSNKVSQTVPVSANFFVHSWGS